MNDDAKRHRPILGILRVKRSSKVEPQQENISNESITYEQSDQELLSTERLLNRKKILERNNTFPRLNANLRSCPSDSEVSNINNSNFKCCSSLTRAKEINSYGDEETRSSSFSPTYHHPSCESYSSPVLLSCRSRFRDKFLLPSNSYPNNSMLKDHSSNPNILLSALSDVGHQKSESCDAVSNFCVRPNLGKATADSLANNALMAAHVFHIPTEKARQRNFLQGRSATNSLLGSAELEKACPNRDVTIFIGSWNMNGQSPPKQMSDFILPNAIEHMPDLAVIGTQECCSDKFEWEVSLQEEIGPSHCLFHSAHLGTLHLAVFIRRDLIWYCSEPEDSSISVRPGSHFKTKGAVAICFCLFGTTMLFVTSHLTAHQQKVKERVQDIKRIIHALDLPRNLNVRHRNKDVTQNFDSVYWCGDLNFRLSEPRANLLKWIDETQFPLPAHLPHGFLHTDQLTSVLADGTSAFKGFKEARIKFPPTYKYDVGTQQFDTSSKQRAPAYTDRILYKYKVPPLGFRRTSASNSEGRPTSPQSPIKCIAYDSVPSILSSDHKPVWALFKNNIRPGIDSIPLAAGLFNREVYIEGIKHRLDNYGLSENSSCIIQ